MNRWNETGLRIAVYPDGRKSCDVFSHLKSASFLPYVMAARWAQQHQLDDALVLNAHDRIADATIANVFAIKDNTIMTPPLQEGGVGGVMRKYLLAQLPAAGYKVAEQALLPDQVLQADELFLTNAIQGIRWVQQCGEKTYGYGQVMKIYRELVQTIWQ
jgi:branched-chain amino acid aminotransferase